MKYLFVLFAVALLFSSCGGVTKEERNEMTEFEDSIKKDTSSINSSVDAANDFLNNDSISADSLVESQVE